MRTRTQRFYVRFLLGREDVAGRFANVDLKRQASVLRSSLYLVLRAAKGHTDGIEHIESIAKKHGPAGFDIPAHMYAHWLDCLLAAARESDSHFADHHEHHWRACVQPCIDHMLRHID